jgi:hypothetical protein
VAWLHLAPPYCCTGSPHDIHSYADVIRNWMSALADLCNWALRTATTSSNKQVVELVRVVLLFFEDVFEEPAGGGVRGA